MSSVPIAARGNAAFILSAFRRPLGGDRARAVPLLRAGRHRGRSALSCSSSCRSRGHPALGRSEATGGCCTSRFETPLVHPRCRRRAASGRGSVSSCCSSNGAAGRGRDALARAGGGGGVYDLVAAQAPNERGVAADTAAAAAARRKTRSLSLDCTEDAMGRWM